MAYPFKLAPAEGEDVNASTMTLTSASGIVSDDGDAEAAVAAPVVQQGEVVEASRPEPQTFVTASDGLDLVERKA